MAKINHRNEVKEMARQWGAEIVVVDTEDGRQIEVAAPDGKRWDEGPATLVAHYGGTWGPASDAWEDLHGRMIEGLLDDE